MQCLNKPKDAIFGKGSCEIIVFEKSHIKITDFHYNSKSDKWKTEKICKENNLYYYSKNNFIPEYFVVKFEVYWKCLVIFQEALIIIIVFLD